MFKIIKKKTTNKKVPQYVDLRGKKLSAPNYVDVKKMEKLARQMRALIFAQVEAVQSGHPGSASKVEQFLALTLGGALAFDPIDPKNPGRDRVIWSAGHCSPCLYSGLSVIYEAMRRQGRQFMAEELRAVLPEDLIRFRHIDGPQGHIENYYPLSDYSTGPSGHGLSAGVGMAMTHKSSALPTKVWVFMGDAESEEGMTYEARNLAVATGLDNLIVSLDYNHFGIDGPIEEVMPSTYIDHWRGLGWNVVEVNGHDFFELLSAYEMAAHDFGNHRPTVVIAHTRKGKGYGKAENTASAHGTPASHEDYVKIMHKLGFKIDGEKGKVMSDIEKVFEQMDLSDEQYLTARLQITKANILSESKLLDKMKKKIGGRPMLNPREIKRPKVLPPELVFKAGDNISMRKAIGLWAAWYMKQTAFFYAGAGDLSKSILTNEAENIYGIISAKNPFGRGIRYGIAEAGMALTGSALSQDILPGGFRPVSLFGSFAVFTTMMVNSVRLTLIGNQQRPEASGFFVVLASHDGPDIGMDGPTHQGLYWMSVYDALPGIKVYKPFDANEVVEMLFYALEKGEPVVLAVPRNEMPVFDRRHIPDARESGEGAYIYRDYSGKGSKKICLAISGPQILQNVLAVLPDLERRFDVKIVNVTSPELFEDLRRRDAHKAEKIFSAGDREAVVAIHNGWKGWLNRFLLPTNYDTNNIGIETYLKSGTVDEVYDFAKLDPESLKAKIFNAIK